eukprot:Protomagalhaensia_wolfi_Nauph_80__1919@NODE_2203_length_1171_cov_31_700530_g1721_i0_p1_GENE_NODE_2203_length_1171_cov_31_700530_g1721_i0NODE_2203_length_1171_cov_31_700530_g1721_i0_p1_ORF_typecomplete_len370_score61_51Piwi/PF02171_17/7e52RWPRK/PF02042_15/0_037TBP/PF00352_21/12TBP/PF00352_21/19_NODE_2203_length_1171_cov_31_700530_g1721_i0611041
MKHGGVCHYLSPTQSRFPALRLFLRDPRASCIIACGHALRNVMSSGSSLINKIPTITSMVCSVDTNCGQYLHSLRAQAAGSETIEHFSEMLTTLMKRRCAALHADQWPSRVILFRDGLSDGSLMTVANRELESLFETWEAAGQPKPSVLYMTARRRQPTRFFPRIATGDNVPPGTCVFEELTLATPFPSFYLVAHKGIKGTSIPTRYVVVFDSLKTGAPEIREMSPPKLLRAYAALCFQLSHLYGRCQRSVALPAPLQYIQLLNHRAKLLLNPIVERTFGVGLLSETSSDGGRHRDLHDITDVDVIIRLLNERLKQVENLRSHFYC